MNDTRDLRDPEKLGKRYLSMRKQKRSIEASVKADVPTSVKHPTCIDKYGRPGDHEPVWERIQIK